MPDWNAGTPHLRVRRSGRRAVPGRTLERGKGRNQVAASIKEQNCDRQINKIYRDKMVAYLSSFYGTDGQCGMKIRRVASRFLILALTVVSAAALNIPHSAFPTPRSPLPTPSSHNVHFSVTNLEFNQPKQTVEIVIRVFTDDLENALSRSGSRTVKIDPASAGKNRRVGDLVMAYLRSNFELKNKAGRPVTLSWNGIEGQVD